APRRREPAQAGLQPAAHHRPVARALRQLRQEERRAGEDRPGAGRRLRQEDLRRDRAGERALHRHRPRAPGEPARRLPRPAAPAARRGGAMRALAAVLLLLAAPWAAGQGDEVIASFGGIEMRAAELRRLLASQTPEVREQLAASPEALERML